MKHSLLPLAMGVAQKWLVSNDSLIAFVNELVTVQSLIAICISLCQTTAVGLINTAPERPLAKYHSE